MTREHPLDVALVVAGHGRHYAIETPEGARVHAHPRGKKSDAVVGDRVRFLPTGAGEGVIEHIEPRRNVLMRQDAWRTKIFAANVDQLLMLVAGEPMFSESQLARALISAAAAAVPALVVLNKIDLPAAEDARGRLRPYRSMGIDTIEVSLKTNPTQALALLLPRLERRVTLVLGPSGAGKSSLINRVAPDARAQVGEISRALGAGRHTTTTTQWYWLDAERNSALIDSPGFQEFGLRHIEPAALAGLMPDIARFADGCRFYDCTHRHEPGCAVREAVARGDISVLRYRIYEQIYDELATPRWGQ